MNLFELKDDQPTFSPQALALKPFKALWDRDKSKGKTKAFSEMSYIYFFCDYRSDFSDIVDEKTRDEQIRGVINLSPKWKIDNKVREAMELYDKLQDSIALQSLKAARIGADKLNKFFEEVDLTETDKSGKPIYKPSDIDNALAKLSNRVKALAEVEEEVKKAIEAKVDNAGSMQAATFEDGIPGG